MKVQGLETLAGILSRDEAAAPGHKDAASKAQHMFYLNSSIFLVSS